MSHEGTQSGASPQRKILIAAAGLVIGALVVDRVILGTGMSSPEDASAAQVAVPATVVGAAAGVPSGPTYFAVAQELPRLPTAADSLAARLLDLANAEGLDPDSIEDGFTPRGMWVIPDQVNPGGTETTRPTLPRDLRLDATIADANGGRALINGRLFAVGEQINGQFTLTAVSSDSATFVDVAGTEFVVRLQERKQLRDGDEINVESESSSGTAEDDRE